MRYIFGGLALSGVLSASVAGNAAGPYDGHWVGEAAATTGCALTRFYFDIHDDAVSGVVTGQLNGLPGFGTVTQGRVASDGTATVAWGQRGFQGAFRFSGDQFTGSFTSSCDGSSRPIQGGRAGAGRTTLSLHGPFDGDYIGEEKLIADTSGRGLCGNAGPFRKIVRVISGMWSYTYNYSRQEKVEGSVDANGGLSGFGASYIGGVRFSGTIRGNDLVGEASSGNCSYSLRMQKLL